MLRRTWLGLALTPLLLAACATPARSPHGGANSESWSGRMALTVQSDPPQSLSAGFELQGGADAGELRLFTPLGSTVAVLAWAPDGAQLERNGQTQRADSVDALIFQLLGTAFPLAALFDWLHQRPTTVAGWQLDNTAQDQGRLVVRRTEPAPAAELRIKLQTP